ncbi:MAG: recombination regulator RecX [Lactobacillales bacterium]|jgi:regulatory protein|nr:recombination regulator RecX [Lactobacillales bacterium]
MANITKLSKDKGEFYQVYLDDGQKLRVSEDVLVKYRLLKGKELDETTINKVKKDGVYAVGLQLAYNYLGYQLRSEWELRKFLKEKEIFGTDTDRIVEQLKQLKLLDDKIYAESYVRTMMRTSDKGPIVIRQQLKKRGVSESIITNALTLYEEENQLAIATHVAQKLAKKYYAKSYQESLQKIKQNLMQKGFSNQVITLAMGSIEFEKDDEAEYQALVKFGEKIWHRNARVELAKRKQKVKQSLYQKGFALDSINEFIEEMLTQEGENGEE